MCVYGFMLRNFNALNNNASETSDIRSFETTLQIDFFLVDYQRTNFFYLLISTFNIEYLNRNSDDNNES